jgi:type VI secretion system protein ImpG
MNRNFLELYNAELQHLRQTAGEFGRAYPKIAGRLSLDTEGKEICPDPFVERLLEGFAYLAARVKFKLESQFPRFTQALFETVYPDYLAPTPSMAVVRFQPDWNEKSLATGFPIPRGTSLRSKAYSSQNTPCTFTTAHDVTLWPVKLDQAKYLDRSIVGIDLPSEAGAAAAVWMSFEATAGLDFSKIKLDRLCFYLRGADELPAKVFEHILTHGIGVWVRDPQSKTASKKWQALPEGCLTPLGLKNDSALLPPSPTTFEGYRLLMEYFSLPQRFLFIQIDGFERVIAGFTGKTLEMAITLGKAEPAVSTVVSESLFDLYSTPALNLFEKHTDRINLSDRFSEYHIVPDRARPLDFEIHTVKSVTGYGSTADIHQDFLPFYKAKDKDSLADAFFTVNRVERTPSENERKYGKVSSYAGSEVFVSLVDAASAPHSSDLQQLGITALCTNRHLPIIMGKGSSSAEFLDEINGPVKLIQCITGPTVPRPSFAMGETTWRLISHLSLNYLSMIDAPDHNGASGLREILGLYVDPRDSGLKKQIEGVRSVSSRPILRRIPALGIVSFVRGIEITVTLDDDNFVGTGIFILGMVLDHFFAKHVTINSFTETVICSVQRGEIIRWPARMGTRCAL